MTTGFSNESAMLTNMLSQYYRPLISGISSDVAADIEKLEQQADLCGAQEMLEEAQNQVTAYLAAQKD